MSSASMLLQTSTEVAEHPPLPSHKARTIYRNYILYRSSEILILDPCPVSQCLADNAVPNSLPAALNEG